MAYKYVTQDHLIRALPMMRAKGYTGGPELTEALTAYADELDYQLSKKHGPPILFKGLVGSTPPLLGDTAAGMTLLTSSDSKADPSLMRFSERMDQVAPQYWGREAAEAAGEGPMWGPGMGRTIAAQIGTYLPQLATTWALRGVGKAAGGAIGGLIGGGGGTAAAPGPGTAAGGLTGVGIGAAVGGVGLPLSWLALLEGSQFVKSSDMYGVDKDIAKTVGRYVALINGGIEEVQSVSQLSPFKDAAKSVASRMAPTVIRALKELGIHGSNALEEMGQSGIQNIGIRKAVAMMRDRYGQDWQPKVPIVEDDVMRAGAAGLVMSVTGTTAARVASTPYHIKRIRQGIKEAREGVLADAKDMLSQPLDKPSERPSLEPPFWRWFRNGLKAGMPDKKKAALISSKEIFDYPRLQQLAKKMGLKANQSDSDLRANVLNNLGLIHEGPRFVETENRRSKPLELAQAAVAAVPPRPDGTLAAKPTTPTKTRTLVHEGPRLELPDELIADINRRINIDRSLVELGIKEVTPTVAAVQAVEGRANHAMQKAIQSGDWTKARLLAEIINKSRAWQREAKKQGKELGVPPLEDIDTSAWPRPDGTLAAKPTTPTKTRTLVTDTPVVDAVQPSDAKFGKHLDTELRGLISLTNRTAEEKTTMLHEARTKALKEAGVHSDMVNELIPPANIKVDETGKVTGTDVKLSEVLTRQQYIAYQDALEHNLRGMSLQLNGELAEKTLDARLFNGIKATDIVDETGKPIDIQQLQVLRKHSILFRTLQPYVGMLSNFQRISGAKFLDIDWNIMQRMKAQHETAHKMDRLREENRTKLPKGWLRGRRRRLFNDLVAYMSVGNKERAQLVYQWNRDEDFPLNRKFGNPYKAEEDIAKRYIEHGRFEGVTTQQVLDEATKVAAGDAELRRWIFQNSGMSHEKFREHYVPLVWEYMNAEDGLKGKKTWEEFVYSRRDKASNEWGFKDKDLEKFLEDMTDMGDTVRALERKGMTVGGEGMPFYEYQRTSDLEQMKLIAERITDVEELDAIEQRMFLRKFYFEDMAPAIRTFIANLDRELSGSTGGKLVKDVMAEYLGAIFGSPELGTAAARQANLFSTEQTAGRMIRRGIDWFNKEYGHRLEIPTELTVNQVVDTMTVGLYAKSLGLPWNIIAPIKNVAMQNPMAAVFGPIAYIKGIASLSDPEVKAWIKAGNFRPEFPLPEWQNMALSKKGVMRRVAADALYVYRMSDQINVYTAAAVALQAWKRIEPQFKSDPTLKHVTLAQFSKMLFWNKTPESLGVKSGEVMANNIPWRDEFKYDGPKVMKPIAVEVYDRIRKGKTDEAKRMFTQYMVNFSQWRYGPGGSPAFLRSSWWRALAMFITWPTNYAQYTWGMAFGGMFKNLMMIYATQALITSVLCAFGFKAYKWFGTGPFPDEMKFTGPFVDGVINPIVRAFHTTGDAIQADLIPTVSEEERTRARQYMIDASDDLWGMDD